MTSIDKMTEDRTSSLFPRLTLLQKIIAGYIAIAVFTVAALVFATNGLVSVNRTAREIARNDLVFLSRAQGLRETLVAQERYAGKYLILGSNEFLQLFNSRGKEFVTILGSMSRQKTLPELDYLKTLHLQYAGSAERAFRGKETTPGAMRETAGRLFNTIDILFANEQLRLNAKLDSADRKEKSTVKWSLILSFTGFLLGTGVAAWVTYSIASAIHKLKKATHRIAEGEFDYDPMIPSGDEIGDLARDFTHMAGRLKELEQISLDASPLTRLPGNIAIEQVLNQRLAGGEPFAVCYADLDNFKAYNDRYGYIKGSELIRFAGEMIYEEARSHAGEDNFIGHIGGDDFVMILDEDKAAELCEAVIQCFDREVTTHYTAEDLSRGTIEGVDRYGVHRIFPIMTISIAVLVCQKGCECDTAVEIARAAAEIKDYLKGKAGSNYFVNRRLVKR